MHIYHTPTQKGDFDTTRKATQVAEALGAMPNVTLSESTPLTVMDVARYHDRRYVEALDSGEPLRLAKSAGLGWSPAYRHNIFGMAGAMLWATHDAVFLKRHGFSLTAGAHHARQHHGYGFCAINSVALGALWAVENLPSDAHVWIIDVDAHAGGGTNDMLERWSEAHPHQADRLHHLDMVVSQFDCYDERPQDLAIYVEEPDDYIPLLKRGLTLIQHQRPISAGDVVIVNAGIDVHERSAIGGMLGITTETIVERERLIGQTIHSSGATFVGLLAGGYADNENPDCFSERDVIDIHIQSIATLFDNSI